MKKKILLLFTAVILVVPFLQLNAQRGANNNITSENVEMRRANGMVTLSMLLNLEQIDLKSQEMMYLIPVLVSPDSLQMHEFDPILITGAKRNLALQRHIDFDNFEFEVQPQMIVRYKDRNKQLYPLTLTLEDQPWFPNAQLKFYEDVTGCRCRDEYSNNYTVMTLPADPTFRLSYISSSDRGKIQIDENHQAYINYKVAEYDILPTFKNNAEVLKEVDEVVQTIRNHPDLIVTEFKVVGYASPEGGAQYNMNLSKNRAESFISYLANKYQIPSNQVRVEWKGQDWEGLYTLVKESNLSDRDNILSILDNEQDRVVAERKIKQLSGGRTYQELLRDYYPRLRRNDYTVSYVSRPFTMDEARNLVNTRPELLSLQEIYQLASLHAQDSDDYKNLIYTAARYYPDDHTVLVNLAACHMTDGNYDQAIQTLSNVNTAEAWNNLGVAHCYKQDYDTAKVYFNRAADVGLDTAMTNRNELAKYLGE